MIDFFVDVETGRKPRVLLLSDIQIIQSEQRRTPDRITAYACEQWSRKNSDINYRYCVTAAVKKAKPDLILLDGDQIYGEFDDSGAAHLELCDFMDGFGIPWAPVFGNHDNESRRGVDWQCRILKECKNCLFEQRTLTGNGNYTVGVRQGGKLLRVYFMTDSNACGAMSEESKVNGHTRQIYGFGDDQLQWLSETAEEIRRDNPSVCFSLVRHIQIGAFLDALNELGVTQVPFDFDRAKIPGCYGHYGEFVGGYGSDNERKLWEEILRLGFDSVFVGHEHRNDFSVEYKGVRLTFGLKSSIYDKINYFMPGEEQYGESYDKIGTPVWGGTAMELDENGRTVNQRNLYV